MLEQVMRHVRNYFVKEYRSGRFSITDGVLSPSDFLLEGQRFFVTGSFLNDGVYTYHSNGIKNDDDNALVNLQDESFNGIVYALAVPPTFIALTMQIGEWVGKFNEVTSSPYQSESFNGYSYTKSVAQDGGGLTWQSAFHSQLNQWRKVNTL